jgi:hypothetical protein
MSPTAKVLGKLASLTPFENGAKCAYDDKIGCDGGFLDLNLTNCPILSVRVAGADYRDRPWRVNGNLGS